ncbi:MAG: ABC transporter ATP-binding protein, partial [Solimonas sp.]
THYMDEAERCHDIVYIADGRLITSGTTADVVRGAGLFAFIASGSGADRLASRLRDAPGVTAAAAFGMVLHVCGPERAALVEAIAPYRNDASIEWTEAEPTLEDIFIHMIGTVRAGSAAA